MTMICVDCESDVDTESSLAITRKKEQGGPIIAHVCRNRHCRRVHRKDGTGLILMGERVDLLE